MSYQISKTDSYQICSKSVMDSSDTRISFDADGVSDSWHEGKLKFEREVISGEKGLAKAEALSEQIKSESSKDSDYDCLIGLSGGIDSSYIALWMKRLGLRPLAVHMDNGWDSELSVANIESIVRKLDIDLHTEVLDWPEFRDLQRSFFFASVPNCEIPTDHAIVSTLFRLARKFNIRYIISGSNVVTEGIYQKNAGYDCKDFAHINAIHKQFGTRRLRSYPKLSLIDFASTIFLHKVRFVPLLNYLTYNWAESIQTLQDELGWRKYPRKHGESLFTRFFQEHYLPTKFGIDKRRMHYSSLICAGQMTRDEALDLLAKPLYTERELADELEFVRDKLQFTDAEFEKIMTAQPKVHADYKQSLAFRDRHSKYYQWGRRLATSRS